MIINAYLHIILFTLYEKDTAGELCLGLFQTYKMQFSCGNNGFCF